MRTVDKALKLLDWFTDKRSEIGLSEMARLSGLDKATVHRMLTALARHGLLEQHPTLKTYRLGAGILRLARLREACFPVGAVVNPVLDRLADETGETAHASLLAGTQLMTIGTAEAARSTRVSIEPGLILPFHATASGIAVLGHSPDDLVDTLLAAPLERYTADTDCDLGNLRKRIAECRHTGIGISDRGYESDVCSTAAPLFGPDGWACGAVTVAAPASRMNADVRQQIAGAVVRAAFEITRGLGGEPAASFKSATERLAA